MKLLGCLLTTLILMIALIAIPTTADRACCRLTTGCQLRTDCLCVAKEVMCRDPSVGLLNMGKRFKTLETNDEQDEESKRAQRNRAKRAYGKELLDTLLLS
uniref:Orexin 1 n=1 Tax=Ophionotus victoriae TaxID=667017 RepID=A0A220W0D6_9ECHI|nr:orexin 1 precursor [Ophionotus victoriae]